MSATTYTITGGCNIHAVCENNGQLTVAGTTVTVTGTPAFVTAFVQSDLGGMQEWFGTTFVGSATGPRVNAVLSGIIHSTNGLQTDFPGNSNGSTAGGMFV